MQRDQPIDQFLPQVVALLQSLGGSKPKLRETSPQSVLVV